MLLVEVGRSPKRTGSIAEKIIAYSGVPVSNIMRLQSIPHNNHKSKSSVSGPSVNREITEPRSKTALKRF
jgi:hypothetical protein